MDNTDKLSKLIIEDSVRELAIAFAERFSEIEMRFPKLRYDFTFPSIGNVERALAHLRFNDSLSNKEQELLRGATAYLTMIAAHAWASVPDNLTISARTTTAGEIVLEAKGGVFLKENEVFSVGVHSSLKKVLTNKQQNFFEQMTIDVGSTDPVVEPFALGLISGLCPFGIGPWKNLTAGQFTTYIEPITKFLARTTAQYYEKVFADGSIDELTELFENSLILPPHGFDEPFIGLRGGEFLIEYLNKQSYSDKAQLAYAQNLASMPTEQISTVGKILTLCLSDEVQVGKFQINPKIRGTVCALRSRLFGESDWLTLINENKSNSDVEVELVQNLFQRERAQELIPNVKLPGRLLTDKECLPLLNTLAWNELELANKGCDVLLQTHASDDFSILLQNIWLLLETNYLTGSIEKLSLATLALSSASIDQSALYFQLGGEISFRLGNYEDSYEYLSRGVTQAIFNTDDSIFANFLRTLVHQQKFERVLELGVNYRERFPQSANISLPICVAAIQFDSPDIAREILSEILWNDPNDQTAFWLSLRI